MEVPSIGLLDVVLNVGELQGHATILNSDLTYCVLTHDNGMTYGDIRSINVYELVHLCKEWIWAKDEDFSIQHTTSGRKHKVVSFEFHNEYASSYMDYQQENKISHTTESEAVFKACEWILENEI